MSPSLLVPRPDLDRAAARLLRRAAAAEAPGFLRLAEPVAAPAPLAWLCGQPGLTQYYWADRAGRFRMAGVGEADVLTPRSGRALAAPPFACMRCRLQGAPEDLRYYGGFRFHRATPRTPQWQDFTAFRFVVPQIELLEDAAGRHLVANLRLTGHPEEDAAARARLADCLAALSAAPPSEVPPLPPILARSDRPDRRGWTETIEAALDAFAAGTLEKVVLARETTLRAASPLDAAVVLQHLSAYSVAAYDFCFHPARDRAFIGASPERLFYRHGTRLETEAIAATRPRAEDPAQDATLAEQLRTGAKERHEHGLVVEMLRERLAPFAAQVEVAPTPELLRLRNVQHLRTPIAATLHTAEGDIDARLLDALHPTPAVGGVPREAALAWLAAREPFDRGIYAAPVGWVNRAAAEFCVAIRSGLVRGHDLALYTGAGIVAGSDPADEWNEIESKMANYLHIFGEA